MDKELSSMSSLLKTNKCSPLIIYIVLVIISAVTMFNTNGLLKKLQNFKVDNIFAMHIWNEVALLIILGVILYGLCQYNQQTLAWIVLFFPLVLQILKTMLIFNSVHAIQKISPPDTPAVVPGAPHIPDPSKGPAPPHVQTQQPTITQQQTEGVRQALDQRKEQIIGAGNQFNPPLASSSSLGASPF